MRKKYTIQKHHRRPRSRGGTDHAHNISHVRSDDHTAFHKLFGNMLANEVAAMLTDTWIDPDYYLVAVPYKKRKGKRRTRAYCVDCEYEVIGHLPVKE